MMKYLKTYEQIKVGTDYHLIMTDDEQFFCIGEQNFAGTKWLELPRLQPISELVVGDFDVYGFNEDNMMWAADKHLEEWNELDTLFIVNSNLDRAIFGEDHPVLYVMEHKDDMTLVKLKKPLKYVPFFVGGFQKGKDDFDLL